jgi:hypothetical protein
MEQSNHAALHVLGTFPKSVQCRPFSPASVALVSRAPSAVCRLSPARTKPYQTEVQSVGSHCWS